MYEVERNDTKVIIRRGGNAVYTASLDSFIIYEKDGSVEVDRVKDLTDHGLLAALAKAVEIPVK